MDSPIAETFPVFRTTTVRTYVGVGVVADGVQRSPDRVSYAVVDVERQDSKDGEWKLVRRFDGERSAVYAAAERIIAEKTPPPQAETDQQVESSIDTPTPEKPKTIRRVLDSFTDFEADVWAKFVLEHYGQRLVGEDAEAKITEAELLADRVVESLRARRKVPHGSNAGTLSCVSSGGENIAEFRERIDAALGELHYMLSSRTCFASMTLGDLFTHRYNLDVLGNQTCREMMDKAGDRFREILAKREEPTK